MSSVDNNMLKPILIGGGAMGLASSIPGLSCLNMCCCLLGLAGGGLSAWLYFKDTNISQPAPYGPAAIVGLGSGAVGGVIVTVLGTLIQMAIGTGMQDMGQFFDQLDLPPEAQQIVEQAVSGGANPGMLIVTFFVNLVLYGMFGALGAILVVSYLQKQGGGNSTMPTGGGSYGPPPGQSPQFQNPGTPSGSAPPNVPPPPQ